MSSSTSSSTHTRSARSYVRAFFLHLKAKDILLLCVLGIIVYFRLQPTNVRSMEYADNLHQGDIVYVRAPSTVTLKSEEAFAISTYDEDKKIVLRESVKSTVDGKHWLFDFPIQAFAMKVVSATAEIETTRWTGSPTKVESMTPIYHTLSTRMAIWLCGIAVVIWLLVTASLY
ncbi:MAG: hypothetical protein UZ21_OP11001000787 [Microgenomates bacterium OLB22]|nr:MAG: hypothetical protein UZ21_OP11001000787 [Microgenomates bacterium OLB22]